MKVRKLNIHNFVGHQGASARVRFHPDGYRDKRDHESRNAIITPAHGRMQEKSICNHLIKVGE